MTMTITDLERVNELAARWKKLSELLAMNIETLKPVLALDQTCCITMEPKVARGVLEQLRRDVESQLQNFGVRPPTPTFPDKAA